MSGQPHEPTVPSGIAIRSAEPDDETAIIRMVNRADPWRPLPMTAQDLAQVRQFIVHGGLDVALVAIDQTSAGSGVVGHGWIRDEAWPPDAFLTILHVDPDHRRRGIGAAILDRLVREAAAAGGRREVAAIASEQSLEGIAFARDHGFAERYRLAGWLIDPMGFDEAGHPPRPMPDTIRFVRFSEIDSPAVRRALYAMSEEVTADMPTPDRFPVATYEEWEQELLATPYFSPETLILAVDGDQPVAICFLTVDGSRAHNHFTAVARSHRGRGIAWNIKLESLRMVRDLGVRELRTENNTGNAPMLAINERLGFTRAPGYVRFGRDL